MIGSATKASCKVYDRLPIRSGTCWRIHGTDLNGKEAVVGVETYQDARTQRCLVLATVFRKGE